MSNVKPNFKASIISTKMFPEGKGNALVEIFEKDGQRYKQPMLVRLPFRNDVLKALIDNGMQSRAHVLFPAEFVIAHAPNPTNGFKGDGYLEPRHPGQKRRAIHRIQGFNQHAVQILVPVKPADAELVEKQPVGLAMGEAAEAALVEEFEEPTILSVTEITQGNA